MAEHEQATTPAVSASGRARDPGVGRSESGLDLAPAPALALATSGHTLPRMAVSGLLALQRAAGNHAVSRVVQRAPTKESKRVLTDAQIEQIAIDVDKQQQEILRVEERAVTMTKIGVYYTTWLDAVNTAVAKVQSEEKKRDVNALDTGVVMSLLLGAFAMMAGPAATVVVGVLGKRLGEIGGGLEKVIRNRVTVNVSSGPTVVTPSQEEMKAVIDTVKAKLDAKWKSLGEEAAKADISALLPKPAPAGTAATLDAVVAAMKQAGAVATTKSIDGTASMTPAQLINLGKALDPAVQTRGVIEGRILKELRSLVDTVREQAKTSNKTFRIDAWGSVGVAILKYTGVSIAASRKATYSFVSWVPPSTVEALGGADKYELFDVDAHRGPNVGPFDGVFVGFLPPPAFATPYLAMIDEYGRPRPALVQDVGDVPHFVRWVPEDESEYETSRGAAKTYGFGEVKGVKPLDHAPAIR